MYLHIYIPWTYIMKSLSHCCYLTIFTFQFEYNCNAFIRKNKALTQLRSCTTYSCTFWSWLLYYLIWWSVVCNLEFSYTWIRLLNLRIWENLFYIFRQDILMQKIKLGYTVLILLSSVVSCFDNISVSHHQSCHKHTLPQWYTLKSGCR